MQNNLVSDDLGKIQNNNVNLTKVDYGLDVPIEEKMNLVRDKFTKLYNKLKVLENIKGNKSFENLKSFKYGENNTPRFFNSVKDSKAIFNDLVSLGNNTDPGPLAGLLSRDFTNINILYSFVGNFLFKVREPNPLLMSYIFPNKQNIRSLIENTQFNFITASQLKSQYQDSSTEGNMEDVTAQTINYDVETIDTKPYNRVFGLTCEKEFNSLNSYSGEARGLMEMQQINYMIHAQIRFAEEIALNLVEKNARTIGGIEFTGETTNITRNSLTNTPLGNPTGIDRDGNGNGSFDTEYLTRLRAYLNSINVNIDNVLVICSQDFITSMITSEDLNANLLEETSDVYTNVVRMLEDYTRSYTPFQELNDINSLLGTSVLLGNGSNISDLRDELNLSENIIGDINSLYGNVVDSSNLYRETVKIYNINGVYFAPVPYIRTKDLDNLYSANKSDLEGASGTDNIGNVSSTDPINKSIIHGENGITVSDLYVISGNAGASAVTRPRQIKIENGISRIEKVQIEEGIALRFMQPNLACFKIQNVINQPSYKRPQSVIQLSDPTYMVGGKTS